MVGGSAEAASLSIGGWCEPLASDSRCINAKKSFTPCTRLFRPNLHKQNAILPNTLIMWHTMNYCEMDLPLVASIYILGLIDLQVMRIGLAGIGRCSTRTQARK